MTHKPESHAALGKNAGLLKRLDKMVQSGRITVQEAERLRTAAKSGEFDDAVREIQLRHAGERVNTAVADGRLTQEEAHTIFDRLAKGEDPGFLRGLGRGIGTDR